MTPIGDAFSQQRHGEKRAVANALLIGFDAGYSVSTQHVEDRARGRLPLNDSAADRVLCDVDRNGLS